MSAAGIVMQAAGGLMNAYGLIQAGNANQRMAEREADVMDYRAKLAEEQGNFNAQQIRTQGKAIVGEQKVGAAGQGIVVGDGTSAQLMEQTGKLSEQDAMQAKLNAAREAWGLREQAKMTRYRGDQAKYQSRLDAIGGLLGTGSKVAGSIADFDKSSREGYKLEQEKLELEKKQNKDSTKKPMKQSNKRYPPRSK